MWGISVAHDKADMPQSVDSRTEELLDVLRLFKGKRLFVAVLGSPDPDGLASAWTLSLMARCMGAQMDILTFEVISRPDNAAFVHLLNIPFKRVAERLPRVRYAGYAVVDRQNVSLPLADKPRIPLLAHIDHHSPSRTDAMFRQQNPAFGSTCSIMAAHFAHIAPNLDWEHDEANRVATALMFGIRTDTADFLNAGPVDFDAASKLAPFVSTEMLRDIVLTPLGKPFLQTLSNILSTLVVQDGFSVGYAGKVGRAARDTLGQTADFLARVEGTQVVVVFGVVGVNVIGSLRSNDSRLDPYRFLDGALSHGLGFPVDCGGRCFAGGFQVPVSSVPVTGEEALGAFLTRILTNGWRSRKKGRPSRRRSGNLPSSR